MNRLVATLSLSILSSGCFATSGPAIAPYERPRTAVLFVDLQNDFLRDDGRMPVDREQVAPLLATAEALAAEAGARGLPVVHVRNVFSSGDFIANWFRNGAAVEGTDGAALEPRAASLSATVFEKDAPDAFSNEALDAFLREREVDHLVLAGVFAEECVYWTARGALNRRYRVTIVRDAVADDDDEDRAGALASLAGRGVRVVGSVDEVDW